MALKYLIDKTICRNCQSLYRYNGLQNIYCSNDCRTKYIKSFRSKFGIVCLNCLVPVVSNRNRKVFCSDDCKWSFTYKARVQAEIYLYGEIKYISKIDRFKKYYGDKDASVSK